MSKKAIEAAIAVFLKSKKSGVLCIRGRWGTGKTYTWNKTLKAAARQGDVGYDRYAYISLFGINSLNDLKTAIVERTINLTKKENLELRPNEESIAEVIKRGEELLRRGSSAVSGALGLVGLGSLSAAASRLTLLTIKHQVVCFDDLERRGASLSIGDVLGLASHLSVERECKIVLILNDEELKNGTKEQFELYLEKVIDIAVTFQPTAKECAQIGLGEVSTYGAQIAEYMEILEITNIRIIQRIKRLVDEVLPIMADRDPRLRTEAVKTLCVLGWIEFAPDAPSWDFVKDRLLVRASAMLSTGEEKPTHEHWNSILDKMDFGELNEMDMELQASVRRGYFDKEELEGFIELVEKHLQNSDLDAKLNTAFRMYESTLAANENEAATAFVEAITEGVRGVQSAPLNAVVIALKALERSNDATKLIEYVLAERAGDMAFFKRPGGPITDDELKQALQANTPIVLDDRPLSKVLAEWLFGYGGISLLKLKEASIDELKEALKTLDGNLDEVIGALLQREELAANGKAIRENVYEALKALSSETRINKLRLKKYIDSPPGWIAK